MSFRSRPLHPPAFSVDCRSSVAWRDTPSALLCQSSRYVRFGAVSDTPHPQHDFQLPFSLSNRPPAISHVGLLGCTGPRAPFLFLPFLLFFAASSRRLGNLPRREMGATEGGGGRNNNRQKGSYTVRQRHEALFADPEVLRPPVPLLGV